MIFGRFTGVVDKRKLGGVSPNAPMRLAFSIRLELCKPSSVACTDAKGDCAGVVTIEGSAVDRLAQGLICIRIGAGIIFQSNTDITHISSKPNNEVFGLWLENAELTLCRVVAMLTGVVLTNAVLATMVLGGVVLADAE